MRVLITGARGFVGSNLAVYLAEQPDIEVMGFARNAPSNALAALVDRADSIVHLAGANRPANVDGFQRDNVDLTAELCATVEATGRNIPVCYASSTQADLANAYGASKRDAERLLEAFAARCGNAVTVLRLPNVFGKWCRPNYNSAVATFCHNIARGLPIQVNEAAAAVTLVYVDDVMSSILSVLRQPKTPGFAFHEVAPQYRATPRELADRVQSFHDGRERMAIDRVGDGLVRALYSTYMSYLPSQSFAYALTRHGDPRGVFVEMLKTKDSGQFSYFTAHPGVTRGGHYHHSKSEKFLVIRGTALFKFRSLLTGEYREIETTAAEPQVVDTIPGWTHDITNTGEDEMIVMLWANEVFDRARPDTVARPLSEPSVTA